MACLKKQLLATTLKVHLGETMFFSHLPGVPAERLLLLGVGDQKKLTSKAFHEVDI